MPTLQGPRRQDHLYTAPTSQLPPSSLIKLTLWGYPQAIWLLFVQGVAQLQVSPHLCSLQSSLKRNTGCYNEQQWEHGKKSNVNCNKNHLFWCQTKLFMPSFFSLCVSTALVRMGPRHAQDMLRRLWQWVAAGRELVLAARGGETHPEKQQEEDIPPSKQQAVKDHLNFQAFSLICPTHRYLCLFCSSLWFICSFILILLYKFV